MQPSDKRGRSRTRAGSAYSGRAMSISRSPYSRSGSRGRATVTHLYMPAGDETKYFDTSQNVAVSSTADWTGSEVPCTNYVQSDGTTVGAYTDSALIPSAIGAGYGNVVGSKYKLKKIRVRGSLHRSIAEDQANTALPLFVRVCLILDSQPNGTQAQGEDVFLDMGSAFQQQFAFLSMGAGTGGRFRILKDFVVQLDPGTTGTDGANTMSTSNNGALFNFTWKPRVPMEVCLKANSATPIMASLSTANIFLLAHASAATVNLNSCARAYYLG